MKSLFRKIFLWLFSLVAAWIAIEILLGVRGEATPILLTGWARFMKRSWDAAAINWSGIGMVILCSAVAWGILCGLIRAKGATRTLAAFWLLFILTMAASGFFMKTGEVIFSKEPKFLLGRREGYMEMRRAVANIRFRIDQKDIVRFWEDGDYHGSLMENLQFAVFTSSKTNLVVLIVPRLTSWKERWGLAICGENFAARYPIQFLPASVAALQKLPSAGWDADLRKYLDQSLPAEANAGRTVEEGFEISVRP